MIRDYVAAGFPGSPVAYAEDYYFHYPKVAFGMWGPLLHISEAAWTLIFPLSRTSVMLLMALISSLTAALLFWALAAEVGSLLAFLAALLFVCVPVVQQFTDMVMADGLVALLDLCAALAFARYLSSGKLRHSAWFGVFASLSILTKGNGVALVLLPAFAVLFTARFSLLKQRSFWLGPAIILCIAGPWQYYSARLLNGILERSPAGTYVLFYTTTIGTILGLALLPFILAGIWRRFLSPALARRADAKWTSAAALICSVWAFHAAIPAAAPEYRYLIAVLPPLLMFLVAGIAWIGSLVPAFGGISERSRVVALAAIAAALFFATVFTIPHKLYHGFDEVAVLLERPEFRTSEILVSSDAEGEGVLISEMALREKRPSHVILRASKMLAQSDWNGQHYRSFFTSPDQLLQYLKSIGVSIVVMDNNPGTGISPHQKLLRQTVGEFPAQMVALGAFPQHRRSDVPATIEVYRLPGVSGAARSSIRIGLPYTLGHDIQR
jgi:hypothetical protein